MLMPHHVSGTGPSILRVLSPTNPREMGSTIICGFIEEVVEGSRARVDNRSLLNSSSFS